MATFHVLGKKNITILVTDFGVVQVTKNVLCAMFVFWRGPLHAFKDVSYTEYNIILSFVYQVLDVNPKRMFWIINKVMYQVVGENVLNNFQDIVLTSSITTLVANIIVQGVMMKEKPNAISPNLKVFVPIVKSSFINLCDSFDEDDLALPIVVVTISMNLRVVE